MDALTKAIRDAFTSASPPSQYDLKTVKVVLGIPVHAYITKDFFLCVCSMARRDATLLTKKMENDADLAKNIYEALKSIKYNKKYDIFYEVSKHEIEYNVFKDEFMDLDKCCVCHEQTSCRTIGCEHPLCFTCENMLKTNCCPVCREPLEGDLE